MTSKFLKMENIKELEIINITTREGKLFALLSYQDINKIDNLNNGFDTIEIPINIRKIQLSHRGNMLVNQSIQTTNEIGLKILDCKGINEGDCKPTDKDVVRVCTEQVDNYIENLK